MSAPRSDTLVLAGAIVVGGALVGAGLFAGLRARVPEGGESRAVTSSEAPSPAREAERQPSAELAKTPQALATGESTTRPPQVRATLGDAERAEIVGALRPALLARCRSQLAKGGGAGGRGDYVLRVVFGTNGQELARAFSETETSAPTAVSCLGLVAEPKLHVAPRTSLMDVSVTFTLP